jgi:ABC-type transporter Mla subunit MlaD
MVETIDSLNQLLRAAEAQKQESITGSLEGLHRNLERSINTSLENMGAKFTESLSGATMGEFVKVSDSLGGAARLLESMNTHFQTTQSALSDLVNFAKASTVEQMALGKTQVEELTAVLRGLMTQMEATTGSSVSRIANALGAMVHELSTKVSELGEQMKNTMLDSAGKATSAASAVIQQADTWSSQNSEKLSQLIDRHETHLEKIKDVQATLDAALAPFKEALGQYTTITADLRQISAQVSATVASTAGTTQIMKDTQNAVQRVASLAAAQVEQLAEANRRQEETWQNISESMRQYQQVFTQVEGEASTLLTDITQNARHLTEISRDGLEKLMKDSNEHFATAAQRLGATVNELDERLTDLTEILAKVR